MAKGHQDKVALITGGANGIGQAFAKRLAEDGVHVAVADMADGAETVRLVEAAGRNALAVTCDVSNEDSVAAMARQVQQKFGRADIVVNCAGIYPQLDFSAMTFADWRRVLSINLDGTFLVTAAFVPGMRARKWGRVVNMASSTFGSVTTGFAHYVASKGGVIGFTRALAGDVAADGITVNAIAPTVFRSPLTAWMFENNEKANNVRAGFLARVPIGRLGEPEDLAGPLLFLCSRASDFHTGHVVYADGGYTAG